MERNCAVIACGYWGRNLVPNFYQLGALRMVCDESSECRLTAATLAAYCEIVLEACKTFACMSMGGG
jgi:hypothetical protein